MRTCDVCGSNNVKGYRDYINGSLCEDFEECQDCPLYFYEFAYGSTREVYGFVEIGSSYTDDGETSKAKGELRIQATAEAKQMWDDPDCRAFLKMIHETPEDAAPKLILADWLLDHGMCEMQEQAIREAYSVLV